MAMTTTSYLDDQGRPRLRPSIVGFLDLLGFSHQVMTARSEDSQRLLDRIVAAIADSRDYVRQSALAEGQSTPGGWAVKFFSDNLTLGYAHDESDASRATAAWFVIQCAQRYQLRMALNGLFLRGGLSCGPLCITDEIIFGSALIDCYQLESKVSIVPRLILSESLGKVMTDSFRSNAGTLPAGIGQSICRDVDGWWFVNYLQAASLNGRIDWTLIERHKASVLESLAGTTRHDVLPKFGWTCRYHNMFCHWNRDDADFSDRYHIDRSDEQSTLGRLSDIVKGQST